MTRDQAIELIAAERKRQIEVEGWTTEHDDKVNADGQLSRAGTMYYFHAMKDDKLVGGYSKQMGPVGWPWAGEWWKPKDKLRTLVMAGALFQAEIDRRDRISVYAASSKWRLSLVLNALEALELDGMGP